MPAYYFERALFVVGERHSGKSKQLRSIFHDARLGTNGHIPRARKLPEIYRLSNERCLYLRLSSPHELGESLGKARGRRNSPNDFLEKTAEKMSANTPKLGQRWNFACALQPNSARRMPNVVATCNAFVGYFNPERVRVVFLNPDWHGKYLREAEYRGLVNGLRRIRSVEVCCVDARDPTANGLLLADFFDFT